ncbi:alpha-helical pore-forming toxin family protein [Nostoc sp. KVJ3]|uniref:alpha-helical pore-forming toxin family protein n=1 Tax=Nostoc sp. KVJ3 TaxID=457945 RepID=UPI002237E719|nr:alpha-helical pore-forming toxin family protein [Nostoc sp. KVJ3]
MPQFFGGTKNIGESDRDTILREMQEESDQTLTLKPGGLTRIYTQNVGSDQYNFYVATNFSGQNFLGTLKNPEMKSITRFLVQIGADNTIKDLLQRLNTIPTPKFTNSETYTAFDKAIKWSERENSKNNAKVSTDPKNSLLLNFNFDLNQNPISPKNLQEVYLSAANNFSLAQIYSQVILEQVEIDVSSIDEGLAIKIKAFQDRLQTNANFFLNKLMPGLIGLIADGTNFNAILDNAFKNELQNIRNSFSNEQARTSAANIFSVVSTQAEEIQVYAQTLATNFSATEKLVISFSNKYQVSLEKAVTALGEAAKLLSADIDILQTEIAQNINDIVAGAQKTGGAVTQLGIGILTTIQGSAKDPEGEDPKAPSVDFAIEAIQAGSSGVGQSSQAMKDLEANNQKLATLYQKLASDNAILAVAKAVQVQNELFINAISEAALNAQELASNWGIITSAFSDFSNSILRVSEQQDALDLASTAQGAKTIWTAFFGELAFIKGSIIGQPDLLNLDAA